MWASITPNHPRKRLLAALVSGNSYRYLMPSRLLNRIDMVYRETGS